MKSFRLTLAMVFIIAFTLIACSEDDTTTDPAAGPPAGSTPGTVCNEDLCKTNAALRKECEEFLNNCLQVEDEDECIGGAWLICQG